MYLIFSSRTIFQENEYIYFQFVNMVWMLNHPDLKSEGPWVILYKMLMVQYIVRKYVHMTHWKKTHKKDFLSIMYKFERWWNFFF